MPSDTFKRVCQMFPDSFPAREWKQWGDNVPNVSGSFAKALWNGDIETALAHADDENTLIVAMALFPRYIITKR